MRKGFSILFALIVLLSGVQFFIAMHFCGDDLAATTVSLSGKLASCGMESSIEIQSLPGSHVIPYCCKDKVTVIGIFNNFTTPVSVFTENTQNFQNIYFIPVSQKSNWNTVTSLFYTSISPPGRFAVSSVNLNDICISRI